MVKCVKALDWPNITLMNSPMPARETFRLIYSYGERELEMGPVPEAVADPPAPPPPPPAFSHAAFKTPISRPASSSVSSAEGSFSHEEELLARRNKLRRVEPNDTPTHNERPPVIGLDHSSYNSHARSDAESSSDTLEPLVTLGAGQRGLVNFGATCYANSVFQVLSNTAPLLNAFLLHVSGIFPVYCMT